MVFAIQIGRRGEVEGSYKIFLRNRIWKLIPIYEGKDKNGTVFCEEKVALYNFKKNLNRICTEISGGKNLNPNNPRYVELLNILEGMRGYDTGMHDEVKDVVYYCCDILNDWSD